MIDIKTSLTAAALAGLALVGSGHAATIGELGILQGSANGGINPATGVLWQTGDQYRLAFVTRGTRNATSANIADYDAFVQSAAATAGWGTATWRCVGQSHNNPSAQTNTGTGGGGGVAIFLVDGYTKIADDYSDLWNGSIDNNWNLTESFTIYEGSVATGSNRKFGDPNQSNIEHGRSSDTGGAWWQVYNGGQSSQWHFYALTDLLTVVDGGPDTDPPLLVSTDPADDSIGFPINNPLVMTFDETITTGNGNITIKNLGGGSDTIIAINDATQVSVAGKVLTINPAVVLQPSTDHAVRIDNGAVLDFFSNPFPGISDDTSRNFTSGGDSLLEALGELTDHINGIITLTGPEIGEHKQTLDAEKERLDESTTTLTTAFDLVTTYDTVVGPLFVTGSPVLSFNRGSVSDEDINWVVFCVMQHIMDKVYNTATLADLAKRALIDGYMFGCSADFPGSVDPPTTVTTHTATINGSFTDTFGRSTQHWEWPARKPTGTYLAPGSIVTVTVPAALVGQGYQVRVGAHSWDHEAKNRPPVKRLSRATILYDIDAPSIEIASPYGGGIYVEVPLGAAAGVVDIDITGAVRSPYFSVKSFHTTTDAEWIATERNHPAPWADFQTEKFMMQVPKSWVDAVDDPSARMADWDAAMDAINDLMGYPHIRGKETMYIQTDVILRSSVHAPGYPATNVSYNPKGIYNGNVNNYFVQGPQTGADIEFHEQGHGYFFPKFGGESESNVNLLYVPVLNKVFGFDLDYSFAASFGFQGNPHRNLDNTAVTWMTVFNFSPREAPMHTAEKAYQLKGHAKFVDIARLFGWEGLEAFWYSFNLDLENGVPSAGDTDSMLLRLCQSVGEDIRPLFHFWGIYPVNPTALDAAVAAENFGRSPEIYELLLHYKSLVPADNAAFQTFAQNWWNKVPSINGNWTEREHARQWDTTELFGEGDQQRPDGEKYTEASAADIEARAQELIDLYFPDGHPGDDYTVWAAKFPSANLNDPNADINGNGLTNNEARIWGLDPTDNSAVSPISVPLDATGSFSYTRRDPSRTEITYEVWTSFDLVAWTKDGGASESVVSDTPASEIETVSITLTASPVGGKLFAQIRAVE